MPAYSKSSGLKSIRFIMKGSVLITLLAWNRKVLPSGAAFCSSWAASTPPPPGLFTTFTGTPSWSDRTLATARPTRSVWPPAL